MRRRANGESDESAWISMADLLVVLCCVGGLLAIVALGRAGRAAADQSKARVEIQDLATRMAELDREAGDLRVQVDLARARNRQFEDAIRKSTGDLTVDPETLVEHLDRYRQLRDRQDDLKGLRRDLQVAEERARDAAESAERALRDVENYRDRVEKLGEEIKDATSRLAAAEAETKRQRDSAESLKAKAATADAKAATLEEAVTSAQTRTEALTRELRLSGEIRRELLGIPGSVANVVFVVDRSSSMARSGRWEDARTTIASWIEHLPVAKAAMIVFGSDVRVIPSSLDSTANRLPGSVELPELTDSTRRALIDELGSLAPDGQTRTARAIRRAMEFRDLDCVILFTDGAPDASEEGPSVGDPRLAVLELVKRWRQSSPGVRMHVVGIGDYFNAPMRDFLLGVAREGNGAFIGR